ncbi:MAG: DUF4328 domain-containing protein [Campylobacteraceae bacterium]|jgi:hypothetical protein|nr:DUF4328 domain-containing protein [Campylobacteraceae bacterium]
MELSSSKKEAKITIWTMWITAVLCPFIYIADHYAKSGQEEIVKILTAFIVSLVLIAIFFVSLVMFFVWFYRAYSNIYELSPNPKYKKWQVVLSWLVPVVNFFAPYFVLKYMYAQAADLANNPQSYENMKKWTTLNIFWALYILMWIYDIVYFALIFPDTSIVFETITCILIVIGVWFTAKIINDYCKLEEEFLHGR